MWTYGDSRAAIRDALRLSRAMTFKSAVAGLPLGGGKGVIMLPAGHAPPAGDDRRDVLLDFGDTVGSLDGAYITAEDIGTTTADMDHVARFTRYCVGRSVENGGAGDPSPVTAQTVFEAIRRGLLAHDGSDALDGRRIGVIGLGKVGGELAARLVAAGAHVIACDLDLARSERFARRAMQWWR